MTPNLSRFSLDLSRFFLILRAFPAFRYFTVSRLISAYLGMSFPSKGLNSGLKWSMNQSLDHRQKPSIYAGSRWSEIFMSGPFGLNSSDPENSAVFRQMPSDICRSPMPAKLFKPFIHQAFQLLWRSFITECSFSFTPSFSISSSASAAFSASFSISSFASSSFRCV